MSCLIANAADRRLPHKSSVERVPDALEIIQYMFMCRGGGGFGSAMKRDHGPPYDRLVIPGPIFVIDV